MKEKNVLTKLPAGEIIEIKKLADGSFEVMQKVLVEEKCASKEVHSISKIVIHETIFVQIEAESISRDDEFMQYHPSTKRAAHKKALIAEAIDSHVKNFYRPIMDPSIIEDRIAYVGGQIPAVGKSYNWWFKAAKKYDPSHNSRLGTRLEYGAFLGVLIKKLVEEGNSIKWAWNAVCNDSEELGHYWDSENTKHGFETTGSRCICGFYDLANTYKVLAEDVEAEGYWLASGCCHGYSSSYPLAEHSHNTFCDSQLDNSVGWIVLS